MESVFFILLITVAGSSGLGILSKCESEISRCNTFTPDDFRIIVREFPPNEEELREICPPLLEAIECSSSVVQECTGKLIEELETSENEEVAQLMSTIQNVMSLMKDVCNGESQLGRDFRASAPCIKKTLSVRDEHCRSEGLRLYEAFRFPEENEMDEEENEIDEEEYEMNEEERASFEKLLQETRCLTKAYEMACDLKNVQKTCGSVARDVLLQVVKRTKLLRMKICTEEDILTLRGQFLDFLEEQGEHRAFFANAFEFRKRRK